MFKLIRCSLFFFYCVLWFNHIINFHRLNQMNSAKLLCFGCIQWKYNYFHFLLLRIIYHSPIPACFEFSSSVRLAFFFFLQIILFAFIKCKNLKYPIQLSDEIIDWPLASKREKERKRERNKITQINKHVNRSRDNTIVN